MPHRCCMKKINSNENPRSTSGTLTDTHASLLASQAIDPERASEFGIYSALSAEDLPADLAAYTFAPPGLVYPLRSLNGDVTHQIRQDNPKVNADGEKTAKYLQPKGSGTIITVPQIMQKRVRTATTLLIVEGTKQTLAAALVCEDNPNVLVIGLQGAYGWKQERRLHKDLQSIINDGAIKQVEVLFDQDVSTNPNVWKAAKGLGENLNSVCGVALRNIAYLSLPSIGGQKDGLDDFLGQLLPARRKDVFGSIRKKGGRLPVDPSKMNLKSGSNEYLSVRMESAQILKVIVTKNGEGEEEEHEKVLLDAAAEIVRSECLLDETGEKTLTTTNFLEVAAKDLDGQVRVHENIEVPDDKLARVGTWLSILPGGAGVGIHRPHGPQDEIDKAIRECSTRRETTNILPRFGWTLDRSAPASRDRTWVYALPQGSFGPQRLHHGWVGRPPQKQFHQIESIDVYNLEEEKVKDAVASLLTTGDLFTNPLQWKVALAVLGLAFLPITPMAAVGYFGARSSGKSTIAQGMSTFLNPQWGPGKSPMATFNGTEAAKSIITNG